MKEELNPIEKLKRTWKKINYTEDAEDSVLKKILTMPTLPPPIEYNPPQKARTYTYPGGDKVRIENIVKFEYIADMHKLTTVEGKKIALKDNWISIEIED